jgi:hypothetical protein
MLSSCLMPLPRESYLHLSRDEGCLLRWDVWVLLLIICTKLRRAGKLEGIILTLNYQLFKFMLGVFDGLMEDLSYVLDLDWALLGGEGGTLEILAWIYFSNWELLWWVSSLHQISQIFFLLFLKLKSQILDFRWSNRLIGLICWLFFCFVTERSFEVLRCAPRAAELLLGRKGWGGLNLLEGYWFLDDILTAQVSFHLIFLESSLSGLFELFWYRGWAWRAYLSDFSDRCLIWTWVFDFNSFFPLLLQIRVPFLLTLP